MVYPTLRATVHNGQIQLIDDVKLPEDAVIFVTVMDESVMELLTAGERLAAGLQDILLGRFIEINSPKEMSAHLDKVFGEA
ncbi:MAG: hypothetical protein M3R47_13175 [Chloroflexota bacterium]|nr:hypothetical protein [Chloroflexota bacterium]